MRAIKFLESNYLYVIWFLIYFTLAWLLLGARLESFIIVSIVYTVSITIALCPLGEIILRLVEGCREPSTEQERNYLLPLFEEVYEYAKELTPRLSKNIKIYIIDAMYVNAYAMGRETIAVTRGAMETFTPDELKGIIAHELGHTTYGHTKALLLIVVGNFFFSVLVLALRFILYLIQFVSGIVAHFNVVGIAFAIMAFITRIVTNTSIFVFVHLSQIILALNSRSNEIQADTFAYEIGYGKELISGMYLLQKTSMSADVGFFEKMKASHPHIADRIANLERLENQGHVK